MRRPIARAAAIAAAAFALLVTGTGVASASTPAQKAVSACGSSYYVQRQYSLGLGQNVTVFLLYSSSTGNNCVVTVKHENVGAYYGTATGLGAGIQAEGGSMKKDDDDYKYYAGPVYLNAPGKCVRFWAHYQEIGASSIRDWYHTSTYSNCS
ncbi:serine/threonine protein kinase [Streptomyces sp. NPDC047804]|uniref:serine/threonine protein kinase n=1 Tax=Streptomyces TaxID=1883 RepID=UPI002E0E2268|nr:serine/threonine protein kinase [[Kitasatospora] papulosa]